MSSRNKDHKNVYVWCIDSKDKCFLIINKIMPWIVIKYKQAQIIKSFCQISGKLGSYSIKNCLADAMMFYNWRKRCPKPPELFDSLKKLELDLKWIIEENEIPVPNFTDDWMQWFVAIIDGEGTITIAGKGNFNPVVSVASTDRDIPMFCRIISNCGTLGGPFSSKWKSYYIWRVSGTNAGRLADSIKSLLILKSKQAEIIHKASLLRLSPDKIPLGVSVDNLKDRQKLRFMVRKMNERGTGNLSNNGIMDIDVKQSVEDVFFSSRPLFRKELF